MAVTTDTGVLGPPWLRDDAVQFHSVPPADLEVRSSGDGRTIYGIAVPWNRPMQINDRLTEQFARGSFSHQERAANRIWFSREHVKLGGSLIGRLTTMRDDAAGQYVELRAAKTSAGDEALELVRDGALNQLSIAFRERTNRRLPGGVIERVKADMYEVALTLMGAYGDLAAAAGVRSAGATDQPPVNLITPRLDEARRILAGLPLLPM